MVERDKHFQELISTANFIYIDRFTTNKKTPLIPGQGRKEGNVLFNDTLSTFYLRLYSIDIW